MSEGMPDDNSPYAQEGTACHTASALCLTDGNDAVSFVGRTVDGVELDEELADAIQTYLDVVRSDKEARGGKLLIEQPFKLDWLHEEFWGTSDACALGTDNVLRVYDAKFGKGKPVEVVLPSGRKNPQLSFYGLGAIERLKRLIEQFHVEEIELVIVQPRREHRDGPVRRVRVTHAELLELSQDLVEAADVALKPNPPLAPGDHCKFCTGAPKCPALRQFVFDAAQLDFDDEAGMKPKLLGDNTVNPVTMPNEQLAKLLDAADVIDAWIRAVRFHAEILANSGQKLPGWKLVAKRAYRKWKDADAAAGELSLVWGLDEGSIFKHTLLSPAQIERLLPKDDRAKLAHLYSAESSGTKLARDGDARTEVAPTRDAQADFDDGQSVDW
jgi:hypothetical protein